MKVKIKTKSNYRNLNGQWLTVSEMLGKRVTCVIFDEGCAKKISVDFNLSDVIEFDYENPMKSLGELIHDTANKVQNILSLTEMLQRRGIYSEEVTKMHEMIIRSANGVNAAIDTHYSMNQVKPIENETVKSYK